MRSAFPNPEAPLSGRVESHYLPTHQYTQRLASSTYPDLHYNGYDQTVVEPIGPGSHRFSEGEFVSPGFYQHVDLSLFAPPERETEWTYSLRRAAQRILPFLYLGPWSCLSNKQWLQEEGITLVLGVRDQRLAQSRLISGQRAAMALGIESDSFDILDNQDLIARLPQAIRRINDHIYPSTNPVSGEPISKKVLLFCETGNGLSALVVVAYVMVMLNLELGPALNFLHSQRFCVDMEDGLKPLLVSFEGILDAKRDVENAKKAAVNSNLAAPTMTLSKKRSFADQVESEDMGDGMEVDASSLGRKPMAPFHDR
ncbi:hypothetical protein BDW59DRAFT_146910 [Aspergillus cavernicola]|uniref:Tyrosine specific protein phosphatases domain-containing protein n=1 Tax=Aspergillus cavernicola TaxID=176166 RepID=A0ABR4IB25_9EURO